MARPDIAELADRVAALLGTHWRTQPESGWKGAIRLVAEDGHGIVLIPSGRSITARGVLPHRRDVVHGPTAPSITMAATSAAYVYGHIRRRLLGRYEQALAQWRELAAEADAQQARQARAADRIAQALGTGTTVTPDHPHRGHTCVELHHDWALGPGAIHVQADVEDGGATVTLRLSHLTSEQAAELCALARRLST